jgi:type II secretory pathway pseudopilin PulG
MKSTIIKIALGVVIIVLGYLLYASIMKPVRFQDEVNRRNEQIVNRLKDIRTAQTLYKQFNNAYTSSFDTLIDFLKTGKIPVVKMVPDPNDTTFSRTINDTVGFINITDSLYSKRPNFRVEDLAVIPFSDGRRFEMETGKIDKGGVMVSVIEVVVPYDYYLFDLDRQYVVNLEERQKNINKYPGIKMGSLTEASTDGNWE